MFLQVRENFTPTEGQDMTRKDYIVLADLIKQGLEPVQFVMELCQILERDNPSFDQVKFLKACGL